ncbi:threonine synthase [Paenibacillus illinoisensis]|uniref:threonine synthase n=1 Tax=Paenibacillus illinoisensis TaxID=59845 RepID=UPI0030167362
MFSYLSHLVCQSCKSVYSIEENRKQCNCNAPIFAEYNYNLMKKNMTKDEWATRPNNIWRYHELLPVFDSTYIVSLEESNTPILKFERYGKKASLNNIFVKNEGALPTGTFKSRGASVGVSKIKEMGMKSIGIATNGNAGSAWAFYAARAGIPITITMPSSSPLIPQRECEVAGGDLHLIHGTIAEAGKILKEIIHDDDPNMYNVSTFNEPYRLEGKKTMGYEIAEQFNWNLPDAIVYPTGGGAGVIGIYKAFRELQQLGWVGERLPKLVVIQAHGCAPIVKAYNEDVRFTELWKDPETVAFGMRVPKPSADFLILDLIKQTNGIAISVDDREIQETRNSAVRLEGLHMCPEGAAALAGTRKLQELGWFSKEDKVLVINTGIGLKNF